MHHNTGIVIQYIVFFFLNPVLGKLSYYKEHSTICIKFLMFVNVGGKLGTTFHYNVVQV